jgi:hypothetical protein
MKKSLQHQKCADSSAVLEDLREEAVIESVVSGKEDHGIETVYIRLQFKGSFQVFGGLCLQDVAGSREYLSEVCAIFNVAESKQLVGQKCIALYSTPCGCIEGLEAPNGKRFTHYGFIKRHCPGKERTPTEKARESLESDIRHHRRRLAESEEKLRNFKELVNWETEGR